MIFYILSLHSKRICIFKSVVVVLDRPSCSGIINTSSLLNLFRMTTLRIEHRISNYEDWRKDFENDPIIRHEVGVLRYRIYLPVERNVYLIIEMNYGII